MPPRPGPLDRAAGRRDPGRPPGRGLARPSRPPAPGSSGCRCWRWARRPTRVRWRRRSADLARFRWVALTSSTPPRRCSAAAAGGCPAASRGRRRGGDGARPARAAASPPDLVAARRTGAEGLAAELRAAAGGDLTGVPGARPPRRRRPPGPGRGALRAAGAEQVPGGRLRQAGAAGRPRAGRCEIFAGSAPLRLGDLHQPVASPGLRGPVAAPTTGRPTAARACSPLDRPGDQRRAARNSGSSRPPRREPGGRRDGAVWSPRSPPRPSAARRVRPAAFAVNSLLRHPSPAGPWRQGAADGSFPLMKIPSLILKQLYTVGSLENRADGVGFQIKNRLQRRHPGGAARRRGSTGAGWTPRTWWWRATGERLRGSEMSAERTVAFPLRRVARVEVPGSPLERASTRSSSTSRPTPSASLSFKVKDAIAEDAERRTVIPYDKENNATERDHRRAPGASSSSYTGVRLEHVNALLLRSRAHPGQHRELHRRRPGAARLRRADPGPRRARPGRVPDPPGDDRGHAGRLVQPRHQGAQPVRRRDLHGAWTTACSARRCSSSTSPARRAHFGEWVDDHIGTSARHAEAHLVGGASCSTSTRTWPTSSPSCASTSPPATRPARTWWGAPPSPPALDPRAARHRPPASTSSRTSPPTRRAPRST